MSSRSWNRVELIGNLTRDPELRYTPTGSAVCTFSIATNRVYVSDGEKKEEADFHRIVAWNKLAELCSQLLKKGNRTFISGRLQNRSWEGQDGQNRNVTEIVAEDMILLTSKGSGFADEYQDDVTPSEDSKPAKPAKKAVKNDSTEATEDVTPTTPKEKPAKEETEDIEDDLPF